MSKARAHVDDDDFDFPPWLNLEEIAPGVLGRVLDTPTRLTIAAVKAMEEGSGAVGRYLDGLPWDREIWVPYVTSPRLDGMLRRRGFWVEEQVASRSTCGPVHVRRPLVASHASLGATSRSGDGR